MVANIKDKAVIVGVGNTEFSKNSGVSELSLAVQAIKLALDDAGLTPADVDGMATFTMDTSDEIEVARAVGIGDLKFYSRVPHGGGAATGLLHQAVMAQYLGDLKESLEYVGANPRLSRQGGAATYGMVSKVPFRGMVKKNVLNMMRDMYGPAGKVVDFGADKQNGVVEKIARLFLRFKNER